LDPRTGAYFYFDRKTKAASWLKPILLGSHDLALKMGNAGQKVHVLNDLHHRAKSMLGFRDGDDLAAGLNSASNSMLDGLISKKCQVQHYVPKSSHYVLSVNKPD
jgi:hypothetical protein